MKNIVDLQNFENDFHFQSFANHGIITLLTMKVMKSEIFFMMNPFLHLFGKAIKDFGFNDTDIFILFGHEDRYPIIENIGRENNLLPSSVRCSLLSGTILTLNGYYVAVSSKNGVIFNEATGILWLVIFYLYQKEGLTASMFSTRKFWIEIHRMITKVNLFENKLPEILYLEMSKVFKKEPMLIS